MCVCCMKFLFDLCVLLNGGCWLSHHMYAGNVCLQTTHKTIQSNTIYGAWSFRLGFQKCTWTQTERERAEKHEIITIFELLWFIVAVRISLSVYSFYRRKICNFLAHWKQRGANQIENEPSFTGAQSERASNKKTCTLHKQCRIKWKIYSTSTVCK